MVYVELTHCMTSPACSPATGCICNCNGCMSMRHSSANKDDYCPNCGACRHCGRGGQNGYWVPYYPQPYNPYISPYQPYVIGPVWSPTIQTFTGTTGAVVSDTFTINYNGGAIGIGSVN